MEQPRLSWHLARLLALAPARKASDLTLLHMDEILFFKSALISRQGSAELYYISYAEAYLRKTAGEWGNHAQLLRITVIPFQPAAKLTVRSWLFKALELAEIDAPGSTSKSASATWPSAVPIASIVAAADWSSVKTMARHYIRHYIRGHPPLNICQFRGQCWEINDLRNKYFCCYCDDSTVLLLFITIEIIVILIIIIRNERCILLIVWDYFHVATHPV